MRLNRGCGTQWARGRLLAASVLFVGLAWATGSAADQTRGDIRTNHFSLERTNNGEVTITTNYYRFGGTNHAQMRAAMLEARPWKQTQTYDAQTKWDVHSNYRVRPEAGQFRVDAVEVRTRIVITLPFWIPGKPVTRGLVDRWSKCVNGLSRHEQGHLVLAEAAGAEVKNRLLALGRFSNALELKSAADRTVQETLEEFRDRERKYDEVTRHGQTQGAVFPMTAQEARE